MKKIINICTITTILSFWFASPSNAELLLFKLGEDGIYYAVDSNTYDKESEEVKKEIKLIFDEYLMVFQWPMITSHFYQQPEKTQKDYLEALKKEHGVTHFVQERLYEKFKDKYKVHFIPTAIFELAAIDSFMEYIINYKTPNISQNVKMHSSHDSKKEVSEKTLKSKFPHKFRKDKISIFPKDDIRNGYFGEELFRVEFESDIMNGLRTFQGKPNADLLAMQLACDRFNLSQETFEMFLQTTSFLVKLNILPKTTKELGFSLCDEKQIGSPLKDSIDSLMTSHEEYETKFQKEISEKDDHFGSIRRKTKSAPYIYSGQASFNYLVKGAQLECQAEKGNKFLLFRGASGYEIDKESSSKIIDSPYMESAEDYAEARKILSDSSEQKYFPVTISNEPKKDKNQFAPYSLSYGNSILAGTFQEAKTEAGARVLDYLVKQGFGYVLMFPIEDFFQGSSHPSLRQKYFIPALNSLVGLFGKGEFFHARNKISIFHSNKKLGLVAGGLNMPGKTGRELLDMDRATQGGLYVTPGVDWTTLHTSISHDIASHLTWINEPGDMLEKMLDTQKRFAFFSSMEIPAFKEHSLKFKETLTGINTYDKSKLNLIKKSESKKEIKSPILGTPIEKMLIPEAPVVERTYTDNVFTKIIKNPANENTKPIIQTDNSLSFEDIRKRTKEHMIVIPKGKYISFSHFINYASPEEVMGLMKNVANSARERGLDKTGYRIITNNSLNPGGKDKNDAEQEVPHFHIHLAGGECLGKPVVGTQENIQRSDLDMTISEYPFAYDWTQDQFYQYVHAHKIGERDIGTTGKKVIAYVQDGGKDVNVNKLIGFVILNKKLESAYTSIDDFAMKAGQDEMVGLFKFINDVAHHVGIDQTGFRLISNFGNDAGQYPKNIMNILIAGGNMLGVTVTNVYGNRLLWSKGNTVFDYNSLTDPYPHEHCMANAFDTYMLVDKYKKEIPETFVRDEPVLNLTRGITYLFQSEKNYLEKISAIKRKNDVIEIIFSNAKKNTVIEDKESFKDSVFLNLKDFKNVVKLRLDNNDLKSIPDIVFDFEKLEDLDISNNSIDSISDNIKKLKNLKKLNISSNKLKVINDNVCELPNLEDLNLSGNDLDSLPDCLRDLKNLKKIHIKDTNLKNWSIDIFETTIDDLWVLKKRSKPLNESEMEFKKEMDKLSLGRI